MGLNRRSTDISFDTNLQDDRNSTATDFSIGPAVGGEYYFSNHFSIGVEARFVYVDVGAPDEADEDFSASRLRTSGAAALRFHF